MKKAQMGAEDRRRSDADEIVEAIEIVDGETSDVDVVDAVEVVHDVEVVEVVDDVEVVANGCGDQAPLASPEDQFLIAMASWLERNEYQVEGKWANPHSFKEVVAAKTAAFIAKQVIKGLLHTTVRVHASVQGGGNSKQVAAAMEPFCGLTDLVGVQFAAFLSTSKANRIIPVILADRLRPDQVIFRFKKFMEWAGPVAKLGMKTNNMHVGMVIYPLIVYMEPQAHARDAGRILKNGWERWLWRRIILQAAVIDLHARRVEWARNPGLGRGGTLFSGKPPLSEEDLIGILEPSEPS